MMNPGRRSIVMYGLFFVVTGCSARSRPAVSNPNMITEAEIRTEQSTGVRDLYELIQRTHPRWLQGRSDRSINLETVILVYHNQQMLGSTEVLRSFPLENIRSIRYLDAAQAGQLPGSTGRHVEAAIVISTR
jgi:hypothetical protein